MVAGRPNSQLVHDLLVTKDTEPTPFLRDLKQKFIEACEVQKPSFDIISYYERRMSRTIEVSTLSGSKNHILTDFFQLQSDGTWTRTGEPSMIVTQDSACRIGLGNNFHQEFPLDTDHSGLVKFDSRADDIYKVVRMNIQSLVQKAPAVVKGRFNAIEGRP
jgi:hypothetical protein